MRAAAPTFSLKKDTETWQLKVLIIEKKLLSLWNRIGYT